MMTLAEIQNSKINSSIAREAYSHADRRLVDLLEIKKAFEQKAFVLFNAYIAISLALLGVAGSLYKNDAMASHVYALGFVGLIFVVGALLFVLALLDQGYGVLGSDPDMWLNRGTIDGEDNALPIMLAYITFYHRERIAKSMAANDKKAKQIRWGVFLGVAAPPTLLVLLVLG